LVDLVKKKICFGVQSGRLRGTSSHNVILIMLLSFDNAQRNQTQ
jgi:hypothetical protein